MRKVAEGVEATEIGRFESTGRLRLKYAKHEVADLAMEFLHRGRPPVVRDATFVAAAFRAAPWRRSAAGATRAISTPCSS